MKPISSEFVDPKTPTFQCGTPIALSVPCGLIYIKPALSAIS